MNARGIEAEVDAVRNELTTLVAELDRRRHELFDVKLQLRRHVLPVVVTTIVGSAALAAAVALGVRRSRQRRTLPARGRRVSEAVGRLLDHPERVGTEPTIVERIAATAGSTVAVYLVKLALDRALDRR
jgi:hypothetical protein